MKNENEKKGFLNALKCFQCNEMVYRTSTASVYADLSEHYKNVHGLDIRTVQMLRKQKGVSV